MDFDDNNKIMFFSCDRCNKEKEYHGKFLECLAQSKSDGWISRKDNETEYWFHYCPSCKWIDVVID
jgi:hypothetical protein